MGKLVVNCINRPKDEMIDCGVYGMYLNMHTHEVDTVEGTLVLGFPLKKGETLPGPKSKSEASEPKPAAKVEEAKPIPQEGGK